MTLFSGTCRTLATTSGGTPRPHIITAAALQISSTLHASFRASPSLSNSALLTASVRSALASPCRATPMLFGANTGYASPFRRDAIPMLFRGLRCCCAAGRCHSVPVRSASRRGRALLFSCQSRPCHATLIRCASPRNSANPRLVKAIPRLSFSKRFQSASLRV